LNDLMFRGRMLLEAAAEKFVLNERLSQVALTCFLSMVPMFEGRYAVTIMVGMGMPVGMAYLLAVAFSTLPMPFILMLLRPVLNWFYTLPFKPIRQFAAWVEKRSANKRSKMDEESAKGVRGRLKGKVSKEFLDYLGLYIFVAVPLPGTGVWTGSAIASLFKMHRGKAAIAILLGNITACALMTAAAKGVISLPFFN